MSRNKGKFFIPRRLPYQAALRKYASLLLQREQVFTLECPNSSCTSVGFAPPEKQSVRDRDSNGCKQRADNQNPSTDPTTENDSFNTENNTGACIKTTPYGIIPQSA